MANRVFAFMTPSVATRFRAALSATSVECMGHRERRHGGSVWEGGVCLRSNRAGLHAWSGERRARALGGVGGIHCCAGAGG